MLMESGAAFTWRATRSPHYFTSDLKPFLPGTSQYSYSTCARLENMELDDDTEDYLLVHRDTRLQPSVPPIFSLPQLKGHDLFEITVDELQNFYSSKAFTSEEYTQFCLDRIQAVNPYLEAVIETNPDAPSIAQQLDKERACGKARGPLHGVPVLVKDVGSNQSFMSSHTRCFLKLTP